MGRCSSRAPRRSRACSSPPIRAARSSSSTPEPPADQALAVDVRRSSPVGSPVGVGSAVTSRCGCRRAGRLGGRNPGAHRAPRPNRRRRRCRGAARARGEGQARGRLGSEFSAEANRLVVGIREVLQTDPTSSWRSASVSVISSTEFTGVSERRSSLRWRVEDASSTRSAASSIAPPRYAYGHEASGTSKSMRSTNRQCNARSTTTPRRGVGCYNEVQTSGMIFSGENSRHAQMTELGQRMLPLLRNVYDSALGARSLRHFSQEGRSRRAGSRSRTPSTWRAGASRHSIEQGVFRLELKFLRGNATKIAEFLKRGDAELGIAAPSAGQLAVVHRGVRADH